MEKNAIEKYTRLPLIPLAIASIIVGVWYLYRVIVVGNVSLLGDELDPDSYFGDTEQWF
ncbi:hypothetical protein L4D09_03820 [Photobacterium makurazakiensis]